MSKVLFREEQTQQSLWVKLLMIAATAAGVGPFVYGLYSQLVLGIPFGDKPISNTGLILFTLFVVVLILLANLLVFKSKLITVIDKEAIRFRYPPMINKERIIRKEFIEKFIVRKYKPLAEYGGYGIKKRRLRYSVNDKDRPVGVQRTRFKKIKSTAYTMNGKYGLQLYLKDGKELLIGTQRPEAIKRAMEKMTESD